MSDERLWVRIAGTDAAPAELPAAGVLVIGSSAERAQLVVSGQGVADAHCAIGRIKGGGFAIKDLGSQYGTVVNGERVQAKRLEAGDKLLLGSRRLEIVAGAELSRTDAPASPPAPAPVAPAPPAPPAELSETTRAPVLGGYRIEKAIGRGAMGKVFLAVQESLDRRVALKVLAPHLAKDAEFVAKFQAEARAAAALAHPNVVVVHDVGAQNGMHYLSMEYMDEGSLEERAAALEKLPWREVLDVLRDAAAGLVYAESRGIVHRDIKPANLMRNHTGATKIADLGLAAGIEATEEISTETGSRRVFGTPHFISPEQARGERVDTRSDIYSLGATAYRLLAGRTPFSGATSREIVRGHLQETPPPLAPLAPDAPADLLAIVERMLRKDPGERFASASELFAEIERVRARLIGAVAAPAGKKRRGLVVGAVGVLLVGAAAAFFATRSAPEPTPLDPQPLTGSADETPDEATVPPDGPPEVDAQATANGATPPTPSDEQIRLFEVTAENALLRLSQTELAPPERIERLRALAHEYDGTEAARKARERALELESELAAYDAEQAERGQRLAAFDSALAAAAALELEPPRPGESLVALGAVAPPAVAGDPGEFVARRRAWQQRVVDGAVRWANVHLSAAEDAARAGQRQGFEDELRAVISALSLPEFEAADAPPGLSQLRDVRRAAEARLEDAAAVFAGYAREREEADERAVTAGLAGPARLERDLRALDLDGARQRLRTTRERLSGETTRGFLKGLEEACERQRGALDALASSFGSWKRRTVVVPTVGGSESRTAVGADARGILVENGGGTEHVPFEAFGARPRELHTLFHERLDREWSSAEQRGIAALLRTSAALAAAAAAEEMFLPQGGARFSPGEREEMLAGYDFAQPWSTHEDDRAALQREREAATLFADALRAAEEDRISAAVAALELLLDEYEDTLLVIFYSAAE